MSAVYPPCMLAAPMTDWQTLTWLNPPPRSHLENTQLEVETAPDTDFWRQTHYGFTHDNGHFFALPAPQEFSVQVRVRGQYQALYDQAGLMLRANEREWIKAGVEFVGQQLSAVVTHSFSDWSVRPVGMPDFFDLKLTRRGDAVSVQSRCFYAEEAQETEWSLLRLAYFPPELAAEVGVYACSPQRGGFTVMFSKFELGPAEGGALY
ncbi:DUF1349 domain-containing protein [Deinococcus psychrotolerans]|nr:DUF1349 domain-containing protein [Deinococcus psychrotolerans]